MIRITPLLLLLVCGCAATGRPDLDPGRGLYASFGAEWLVEHGYPDRMQNLSSRDWGQLYDDDGRPYGPNTYLHDMKPVESHPQLTRTDEILESPWVRLYRTRCCAEDLQHHLLEVMDLQWHDMRDLLRYTPQEKVVVYSPVDLDQYGMQVGNDFWNTHQVDGAFIILEPAGILHTRTILGHVTRAAMALSFLDLKCRGRLPMWFREGLSSYLAEEGNDHVSFMQQWRLAGKEVLWGPDEMLRFIHPLVDREQGRIARYNAFLMIWNLSETYGFARVQQLLDLVENGALFEEAAREVYGMGERELLTLLDPRRHGEPTTKLVVPERS